MPHSARAPSPGALALSSWMAHSIRRFTWLAAVEGASLCPTLLECPVPGGVGAFILDGALDTSFHLARCRGRGIPMPHSARAPVPGGVGAFILGGALDTSFHLARCRGRGIPMPRSCGQRLGRDAQRLLDALAGMIEPLVRLGAWRPLDRAGQGDQQLALDASDSSRSRANCTEVRSSKPSTMHAGPVAGHLGLVPQRLLGQPAGARRVGPALRPEALLVRGIQVGQLAQAGLVAHLLDGPRELILKDAARLELADQVEHHADQARRGLQRPVMDQVALPPPAGAAGGTGPGRSAGCRPGPPRAGPGDRARQRCRRARPARRPPRPVAAARRGPGGGWAQRRERLPPDRRPVREARSTR